MEFYAFKEDYVDNFKEGHNVPLKLFESTSVIRHKKWFFECLRKHGRIITLDSSIRKEKLTRLLNKPGAIFVSVHHSLDKPDYSHVRRRTLILSLGSLLVYPEGLYQPKCLPSAEILLLSTDFQIKRLEAIFDNLMPKMYAFAHKIDIDFFTPSNKRQKVLARKRYGIEPHQIHLLYAGRFIVTKGICQLIRVLDIWPIPNLVLTLAGNIEKENRLEYSYANHRTFANFLDAEVFGEKKDWLRFQSAKGREDLRELFWSADLFVSPSIHPDEDFGVTPRQAISCGLPIVTTNFCGLNPLAEGMPWKGVDTYPTLLGSRFSLRQFRQVLYSAVKNHHFFNPREYRKTVVNECTPAIAKENLKNAVEYLKDRPAEKPVNLEIVEREVRRRLFNTVEERALKIFIDSRQRLSLGSYAYGDGPRHYALPIIQGIYSAAGAPPKVERHTRWRGFFRMGMWKQERALVEFGFPGPRIKRYPKNLWRFLYQCAHLTPSNDYLFTPINNPQIFLVQELVDLGYLVSDKNEA